MLSKFLKNEQFLEAKMKQKLEINLEFFYVDGTRVGVGHADYNMRKIFPLIHDIELEENHEH